MPRRLALPFRVTTGGAMATVEQDSPVDLAQSIRLLLDTRPGERRSVPGYGIGDPLFAGVTASEVVDVISDWEPRATGVDVETAVETWTQTVEVTATVKEEA